MMNLIQAVHIMHACLNRHCQKGSLQIIRPAVPQSGQPHIVTFVQSFMMNAIKQNSRRDQNTGDKKQVIFRIGRKQLTRPHRRNAAKCRYDNDRRRDPFPYGLYRNQPVPVRIFSIIFPGNKSHQNSKQHKQGITHQCLALSKRNLIFILRNNIMLRIFYIAII